jgi:hypothetical protein
MDFWWRQNSSSSVEEASMTIAVAEFQSGRASSRPAYWDPWLSPSVEENLLGWTGQRAVCPWRKGPFPGFSRKAENVKKCATFLEQNSRGLHSKIKCWRISRVGLELLHKVGPHLGLCSNIPSLKALSAISSLFNVLNRTLAERYSTPDTVSAAEKQHLQRRGG